MDSDASQDMSDFTPESDDLEVSPQRDVPDQAIRDSDPNANIQSPESELIYGSAESGGSVEEAFMQLPPEEINYRFDVDYEPLHELLRDRDGAQHLNLLKSYVETNFKKISGYHYIAENVAKLINQYGPPGSNVNVYGNPGTIVTELQRLLDTSKKKWEMFNIPIQMIGLLKGSVAEAKIKKSSKKISEVLESASRRAIEAEERFKAIDMDMKGAMDEIENLRGQLHLANNKMKELKGEREKELEDPPGQEEFVEDLKARLEMKENFNSSLIDELQYERERNLELLRDIWRQEDENIEQHKERMKAWTEALKYFQLNEGLQRAIARKIRTLEADDRVIAIAVTEWVTAAKRTIESKQPQLNYLAKQVKDLDDAIAEEESEFDDLTARFQAMNATIPEMRKDIEQRIKEYQVLLMDGRAFLGKMNRRLGGQMNEALQEAAFRRSFADPELPHPERRKRLHLTERVPFRGPIFEGSADSTEERKRIDESQSPRPGPSHAPSYSPRRYGDFSPPSHHSTPSGRMPVTSEKATSPFDWNTQDMQSFSGGIASAGTQTSNLESFPGITPLNPSTQTISRARNRFDVGESFNMQTVHDTGASHPYSQMTRVDSSLPQSDSNRMSDSPFSVRHRAELGTSPDGNVTPFVSTSRFGYTDPTARALNIPPGFVRSSALKKQIVLTSPRRREPLLVNIDVDPKPLVQTASGEHFVCDISLNVQQASAQEQPRQAMRRYGEPPEITPTSARRHGLFTPRGIFKRNQFTRRKVHWPDEYSEMPWSPHDLPPAHSPITSLAPSPYISDTSISWERSPESPHSSMNRTYEKSSSPVIEGPQYGRPDRAFTESPSPVIKGPYYRSRFAGRQSTPDTSPSPIIKGPRYGRRSPVHDRTFNVTPPSAYDRASPVHDRTFDVTPPSAYDRASPVDGGIFNITPPSAYYSTSPVHDRAFSESPSPIIKGPSYRGRFTRQDQAFDRSPTPSPDRFHRRPSPSPERAVSSGVPAPDSSPRRDRSTPSQPDRSDEDPVLRFYW